MSTHHQRISICGGAARGRILKSGKGGATRPTAAGLREALANILRPRLPGAQVLDLYAGFGTVALELLSQGAAAAVLVERDGRAANLIRENVALLDYDDRAEVWTAGADSALHRLLDAARTFDIIFVDPPYSTGEAKKTLEKLGAMPQLLNPGAVVVVQHSKREDLPPASGLLQRTRERQSGDTLLSFYGLDGAA